MMIGYPPLALDAVGARIRLAGGARLREARATVLTHEDLQATNTFTRPDEVAPAPVSADTVSVRVPPQAMVPVTLQLA